MKKNNINTEKIEKKQPEIIVKKKKELPETVPPREGRRKCQNSYRFNKKTNIFALHAKNIEIEKIQLDDIDIKYEYDELNELIIIMSEKIIEILKKI